MNDEATLLDVIREHPDEDTPRLMFADWLDEHGQPEPAEFIRAQVERAKLDRTDPRWRELLTREAELVVAGKNSWLSPYFPWCDWSNLLFTRGFVERITTTSAGLVPHLDSLRKLTTLLELRLRDYHWIRMPAEEDPFPPSPSPERRRSWLARAWEKVVGAGPTSGEATPRSCLCRVSLAERPRGLRIRVVLGECWGNEPGMLALELLQANPPALEPPLRVGEWTVLVWSPDVPDEWRLVGRLARVLCENTQKAALAYFRQRVAARPLRSPEEFAAWCPLALPATGPYWLRYKDGVPIDYCTGFSPPDDWLGGVSL